MCLKGQVANCLGEIAYRPTWGIHCHVTICTYLIDTLTLLTRDTVGNERKTCG